MAGRCRSNSVRNYESAIFMALRRFDIGQHCSGFPDDDQLAFRSERCCIVLLVEHLLKTIRVDTKGVQKVYLNLEHRKKPGLTDNGDFGAIANISWPCECARYFAAEGDGRSRMLADASEGALLALAQRRGWTLSAIREIFAEVRAANYVLVADRTKACRSPNGTKRARVSYYVDRTEFRIDVAVTGRDRTTLLQGTVFSAPPTFGLCAHFTLGKPFWNSNHELVVPYSGASIPNGQILVQVP
jgi:hypothetical protein